MKTVINVKVDKEVKEEAKKVGEELGLSLSAIVNAYLKQFVRNRSISLSSAPRMSVALEELLGGIERDIREKKNISGRFNSPEEAADYLDAL